jgi:signal transduction histidine kinase
LGGCGEIHCNRGQIGQVILNVLVNAIHAIRDQQRETHGNITVRTEPRDDGVSLVIEDDGPGIPEANKARIFDPFFTTKDIGQGTGLGLSISQDIVVNKHKGRIHAEDAPGGGTRFVVWLPNRRGEPDAF